MVRKICAFSTSASPKRGCRISSRGTFCGGHLSDLKNGSLRHGDARPCAARVSFVRGNERRTEDGGRSVCATCVITLAITPTPRDSDRGGRARLLSAFTPSVSHRRRKGCNSLLARSGSGGGRGDYSPRSRFADDDKRESADPIADPTRSLSSRIYPFLPFVLSLSLFVSPLIFFVQRFSRYTSALFSSFTFRRSWLAI